MKNLTINGTTVYSQNTLEGQRFLRTAQYNEGSLFDVYQRPSCAKIRAWRAIEEAVADDPTAAGLHVCGHNVSTFSCAYTAAIQDSATGERARVYVYYTASRRRLIAIDK